MSTRTTTRDLVATLKANDQDFEWYPTTDEMIYKCLLYIPKDAESILDIGAGDGRVLEKFALKCEDAKLYGIEISQLLVQQQPKNVIPVGTDLFQQNLSCLPVDYIFCNPIYSQYEEWTCKIISEGYAKKAFLVIPTRWKDSPLISKALKQRGADTRVIFTGDFTNAERQARAVIDIVEVTYPTKSRLRYGENNIEDPFDIWFDQNVATFDGAETIEDPPTSQELARRFSHANIAEMVESYREEYARLEKNYRAIFELDLAILEELGINKENVREGLKKKMTGLKNKYWKVLFTRLDALTSRLTTKSKDAVLQKLNGNTAVEFTEQNAYAVVLWAIKNANQYFDDQLVDLFFDLATFEGVEKYKSNVKTWEKSGWRWNMKDYTHYKLDYRIVVSQYKGIYDGGWYEFEYPGKLHNKCHNLIADIIAVLSNLGFHSTYSPSSYDREWKRNKWQDWTTPEGEVIFQIKAFNNGNVHLRFLPDAIKALNIEAARLLKWVRSAEEIVEEMGYTPQDAEKFYLCNSQILPENVKLLTG